MAYTTDMNTGILDVIRPSRKALVETRDSIEGELDDLYQKAIQVTVKERFTGGNANDIANFYARL